MNIKITVSVKKSKQKNIGWRLKKNIEVKYNYVGVHNST